MLPWAAGDILPLYAQERKTMVAQAERSAGGEDHSRVSGIAGTGAPAISDDEGKLHAVTSGDVNDYLRSISGRNITAKDFRTWAGTLMAAKALHELPRFDSAAQAKRNLRDVIKRVSDGLGNTPTICRKCYVHPQVLKGYLEKTLVLRFDGGLIVRVLAWRPMRPRCYCFLEVARIKTVRATRRRRKCALRSGMHARYGAGLKRREHHNRGKDKGATSSAETPVRASSLALPLASIGSLPRSRIRTRQLRVANDLVSLSRPVCSGIDGPLRGGPRRLAASPDRHIRLCSWRLLPSASVEV